MTHRGALRALLPVGVLLWPMSVGSAGLGPQTCDTSRYPPSTPTDRFLDHGDGTVTDKQSNLMWMRCAAGQTWVRGTCEGSAAPLTWQSAQEAAQAINRRGSFFYNDWRVPQVPELATIAERQCKNPRINLAIFPNTPAEAFWTETSRPSKGTDSGNGTSDGAVNGKGNGGDTGKDAGGDNSKGMAEFAFVLSFGAEGVNYESKEQRHNVRLVRNAP